jgi:hypothetical protein
MREPRSAPSEHSIQGQVISRTTTRFLRVHMEKDVVALSQLRRRARGLQRSAVNRKDALSQARRLLHLPGANFRARRGRREHENHRFGLADQVAESSLPVLAT